MLESIKRRINKVQNNTSNGEALAMVAGAIDRKAYYDELTEEEKNAYCAYYGTEREALEEVNGFILGTLHFPVERKEKPLTEAQFRERVEEVEALVMGYTEEYNAPEAKAMREEAERQAQEGGNNDNE